MKIRKFSLPYLLLVLIVGCFHKATPVGDSVADKNITITVCFEKETPGPGDGPQVDRSCHDSTVNLVTLFRDGYTTKYEIEEKLGEPQYRYWSFKNRRIIIYEIKIDTKPYQVVLVFDENSVLSRHSLVKR